MTAFDALRDAELLAVIFDRTREPELRAIAREVLASRERQRKSRLVILNADGTPHGRRATPWPRPTGSTHYPNTWNR